jgi:beta-lactamase regulating signal transducer with metallopeptidase domain
MTAPLLLAGILRGAVLLGAVLLVLPLFRRQSAAIQHAILCAAIAAQVVIPILTVVSPAPIARLVPETVSAAMIEAQARVGIEVSPVSVATSSEAADRNAIPVARVALFVWLTGFAALIAWMLYGRIYMRRLVSGLAPLRNEKLVNALDLARSDLRVRRPVTLLKGGDFFVPVTLGLVYPVILMPSDAESWTDETTRLAMVHEVSHIKRNDPLVHLVISLAAALTWFNPLVWVALSRARTAAERAADDTVIRAGVKPTSYVDTLVDMVKRAGSDSIVGSPSFAMARRKEFETRMLAVLDERTSRSVMRPPVALVALAIFAAFATLVAAVPSAIDARPLAAIAGGDENPTVRAFLRQAEQADGDAGRIDPLKDALSSGKMNPAAVEHYLSIVERMSASVPLSLAISELASSTRLDRTQVNRALGVIGKIEEQVPRSVALIAIARSNRLDGTQRDVYTGLTEKLRGPSLTSALEALK